MGDEQAGLKEARDTVMVREDKTRHEPLHDDDNQGQIQQIIGSSIQETEATH